MSETEKNKGGRPSVNATPITLRLPPDMLSQLDTYIADQRDELSRPEAVRRIMHAWLVANRYAAPGIVHPSKWRSDITEGE